jgi:hypothetical protein
MPRLAARALDGLSLIALIAMRAQAQDTLPRTHQPRPTVPEITVEDLRTRLYLLADDSLAGRRAGTAGDFMATDYIASEMRRLGLEAAGEAGTYFQRVPLPTRFAPEQERFPARNVVGIVRGSDPVVRGQYIAISAHNDHIGLARRAVDHDSLHAYNAARALLAPGASPSTAIRVNTDSLRRLRPPRADSIANGADDDASGTAALLEIAEALATAPTRPKRSILIISHTAEEEGLVGSRWFSDHPTVPRDSIVAELDLDMVGRGSSRDIVGGGPGYLEVVGARRLSTEMGTLVDAVNQAQPLPFTINYAVDAPGHPDEDYCRADHFNYARYGLPSVNFARGEHGDYHQVTDEAQYIDYPDLARVTTYVRDLARRVADLDHRLTVDKPKPDPNAPCVQ